MDNKKFYISTAIDLSVLVGIIYFGGQYVERLEQLERRMSHVESMSLEQKFTGIEKDISYIQRDLNKITLSLDKLLGVK